MKHKDTRTQGMYGAKSSPKPLLMEPSICTKLPFLLTVFILPRIILMLDTPILNAILVSLMDDPHNCLTSITGRLSTITHLAKRPLSDLDFPQHWNRAIHFPIVI